MTVGRFTGGWFIDRYSRVAVVRASALMGALGIGLIIFVDSAWVAGVSVVLWGLGASLGFPLTISAASDTGPDAPTRVSVVADRLSGFPRRAAAAGLSRRTLWIT